MLLLCVTASRIMKPVAQLLPTWQPAAGIGGGGRMQGRRGINWPTALLLRLAVGFVRCSTASENTVFGAQRLFTPQGHSHCPGQ